MGLAAQIDSTVSHVKHSPVVLSPKDSVAASFCCILENVLSHISGNIQPTMMKHPEGLHQLRTGVRRLRSALRLYEPVLPPHSAEPFDKQLRNFAKTFGVARDWDVFLTDTLVHYPQLGDEHGAKKLQYEAYRDVHGILRAPWFEALLHRITEWSEKQDFPHQTIEEVAPDLLGGLAASVKKRRRKADLDDDESLHKLRKAAKRLRYGVEFTGGLYGKKSVTTFHADVKDALDYLGELNDAATTRALVYKLDVDYPNEKWLRQQYRNAHSKMPRALDKLRIKPYW